VIKIRFVNNNYNWATNTIKESFSISICDGTCTLFSLGLCKTINDMLKQEHCVFGLARHKFFHCNFVKKNTIVFKEDLEKKRREEKDDKNKV